MGTKANGASDGRIDWTVAKLFPEAVTLPKGKEAYRKKFGISKEDGSTIAYYEQVEDTDDYDREKITLYQYAMVDDEPFLVEEFEPRFRDVN
jgi:hypothetical protein